MVKVKWYPEVVESLPSLEGKTVVITGTTSGTGLVALKTIIGKGGSVVALNRNVEKAQKAVEGLELGASTIQHVKCDLQDLETVKAAGDEVLKMCDETGIYCLANNAGIMMLPDLATKDGFDIQMQTNHLSHFLLTKMLLPLLHKFSEKHGEARVVNHSSVARNYVHHGKLVQKYFEKKGGHLGGGGTLAKFRRYSQSKLANAVFTYALQDYLNAEGMTKIKSVVCHPGIAKTELTQNLGFSISNIGDYAFKTLVMGRNSQAMEDGALGLIKCIFLEEVESGDFYGPGAKGYGGNPEKFPAEKYCYTEANKKLLWDVSEQAVAEFLV